MKRVKYIAADTLEELERKVNAVIDDPDWHVWETFKIIGNPLVGFIYVQCLTYRFRTY